MHCRIQCMKPYPWQALKHRRWFWCWVTRLTLIIPKKKCFFFFVSSSTHLKTRCGKSKVINQPLVDYHMPVSTSDQWVGKTRMSDSYIELLRMFRNPAGKSIAVCFMMCFGLFLDSYNYCNFSICFPKKTEAS